VDVLGELAGRKKATRAQLALAWVLAQKPWMVPIPGTTKLHRLEENNGAASLELSKKDLNEIEQAFAGLKAQGARYPEQMLKLVGR
jgi:aryl-alcohol dehydrogenase-like predicted oxidoreductase